MSQPPSRPATGYCDGLRDGLCDGLRDGLRDGDGVETPAYASSGVSDGLTATGGMTDDGEWQKVKLCTRCWEIRAEQRHTVLQPLPSVGVVVTAPCQSSRECCVASCSAALRHVDEAGSDHLKTGQSGDLRAVFVDGMLLDRGCQGPTDVKSLCLFGDGC